MEAEEETQQAAGQPVQQAAGQPVQKAAGQPVQQAAGWLIQQAVETHLELIRLLYDDLQPGVLPQPGPAQLSYTALRLLLLRNTLLLPSSL